MRKWFSETRATKTFTFSREMTREEIEETSRQMDAAFAKMDEAFGIMGKAFDGIRD